MKHLKKFNELINERFNILMITSERDNLESQWGVTIEDIEDILLELADLSALRGNCKIKTPTHELRVREIKDSKIVLRLVPELIVLANIKVSKEEYESVISTIKNRLSRMNLEVEDNTMEHERTKVELGIYHVCLRLMLKSDAQLINSGSVKKILESKNDHYYENITSEEFTDLFYRENEDFTEYEISEVKEYMSSKHCVIEEISENSISCSHRKYWYRRNVIYKINDEWFIVVINLNNPTYYKCDQLDGLIELIKKEF